MSSSASISRRSVLKYTLMPQIFPRLKTLFGGGFGHLSYFIAVVFNTLRILPDNHIYLNKASHGHYSVIQALSAAANHIPFNRKNIDKVTIFGVVLMGLAMMALQIVLLVMTLFTGRAMAYNGPGLGPRTLPEFFDNANTDTDLAFRFLDLVFGIPNIFNSSEMGTTPFHEGLHALFEFYSFGLLIVATIIIVYLTMAIVMETAESGVPFGKRFNKAWAPVRIVLFFGLLLPMPSGINLAQYLLLNAAKLGSNVATNSWILFDQTSASAYAGRPDQLIARPNTPDLTGLLSFMVLSKACSWAEGKANGYDVQAYLVYGPGASNSVLLDSAPAFSTVANNVQGGNVIFRFGVKDDTLYERELGAVRPVCGELVLPLTDVAQPGSAYIQQGYIEMVRCLWDGSSGSVFQCNLGTRLDLIGQRYTEKYGNFVPRVPDPDMTLVEGGHLRTFLVMSLNNSFNQVLEGAMTEQTDSAAATDSNSFENPLVAEQGWAGAGIWFNKIAEQNGAFTAAVFNQPQVRKMPEVMEFIRVEKMKQDVNIPPLDTYTPSLSSGQPFPFETPEQLEVSTILKQLYTRFADERAIEFYVANPVSHANRSTGNTMIDTINLIMGTQGLFDMCRNTDIHPLAQLASLGKGLVEHSIRGFGLAAGVGLIASVASIVEPGVGASLRSITGFFINIATIGLMMGIVLFYVIPFLPFIYFFFAVMTWVKSIFEAMVGMPLWALAHIRIDSEGMPGDSAEAGYYYILEIFLRPIFIIISFLGAIIIFSSLVKVLNQVFYLVISNLSGHTAGTASTNCFVPPGSGGSLPDETAYKRGTVDEFFYTAIYTIIVYLMATPCFKLVDAVPDRLMRWLGTGISTFGAQDGDPAQGLVKNVTAGAGMIGGKLQGTALMGFFK